MIAALLLAAAAPQTAVEAERAFAADAQSLGQWTAFRKWAAPDATMFLPQPASARAFLAPLKDPAKAVDWWPTASYLSCDGRVSANTGGARWPDGHASYFSTIWARQPDGSWRWRLDHGDDQPRTRPRPARGGLAIRRASCQGKPVRPASIAYREGPSGEGGSADGTLIYRWHVGGSGARTFAVLLWNGTAMETVIDDQIAAPPQPARP